MSATVSMTIKQLYPVGSSVQDTLNVGNQIAFECLPLDASGNASGARVNLVSSNLNILGLTTPTQTGNAPAAVIGIGSGTATLTATAQDGSGITATQVFTVN